MDKVKQGLVQAQTEKKRFCGTCVYPALLLSCPVDYDNNKEACCPYYFAYKQWSAVCNQVNIQMHLDGKPRLGYLTKDGLFHPLINYIP